MARPLGHMSNGIPMKAMVVDDEFGHRRLMAQVLRSAGFDVVNESENGEEALHYLAQLKPDLLLMDYHMPRMEGDETLAKIRENNKDLKVIMFTTETDKELVTKILKLGANDYIVKPIDRLTVLKKLIKLYQRDDVSI